MVKDIEPYEELIKQFKVFFDKTINKYIDELTIMTPETLFNFICVVKYIPLSKVIIEHPNISKMRDFFLDVYLVYFQQLIIFLLNYQIQNSDIYNILLDDIDDTNETLIIKFPFKKDKFKLIYHDLNVLMMLKKVFKNNNIKFEDSDFIVGNIHHLKTIVDMVISSLLKQILPRTSKKLPSKMPSRRS